MLLFHAVATRSCYKQPCLFATRTIEKQCCSVGTVCLFSLELSPIQVCSRLSTTPPAHMLFHYGSNVCLRLFTFFFLSFFFTYDLHPCLPCLVQKESIPRDGGNACSSLYTHTVLFLSPVQSYIGVENELMPRRQNGAVAGSVMSNNIYGTGSVRLQGVAAIQWKLMGIHTRCSIEGARTVSVWRLGIVNTLLRCCCIPQRERQRI